MVNTEKQVNGRESRVELGESGEPIERLGVGKRVRGR